MPGRTVRNLSEPGEEKGAGYRKRIGMGGCFVPTVKTPGMLFIPDLLRYHFMLAPMKS